MSDEENKKPGDTKPGDTNDAGVVQAISGASISGEIILPADDEDDAATSQPEASAPAETRDEDQDPTEASGDDILRATDEHNRKEVLGDGHGHGHGHGHGPPPGEPKHYFDHPENVTKLLRWFYGGCVLLIVIELVNRAMVAASGHGLYHVHPAFPEGTPFAEGGFEEVIPTFYCMYGFAACTILVILATQLRKVLMRREDYYDV